MVDEGFVLDDSFAVDDGVVGDDSLVADERFVVMRAEELMPAVALPLLCITRRNPAALFSIAFQKACGPREWSRDLAAAAHPSL